MIYRVLVKLPRKEESHWGSLETVSAIIIILRRDPDNVLADWVGSWDVGEGGQGVASLWVKQSPQNVVCDVSILNYLVSLLRC